MLNTLKTTFGFLVAVIEKNTPFKFGGDTIKDIYNYRQISDNFATSGQPTEAQFKEIQAMGYTTVINLAPQSKLENSLITEAALLNDLGIDYVHIPVNFDRPTDDDFKQFVSAIQARTQQKIWIHCAANMRVSAFVFRYRTSILKELKQTAQKDLDAIWQPFGVWKKFISIKTII